MIDQCQLPPSTCETHHYDLETTVPDLMTPGHRSRFVNHAVQPPVIRISFDAEELPMSPDTVDNLKWVEQANVVQAQLTEASSRFLDTELTATGSRVTVNRSGESQ
jgi:hypothetical protein